VVRLTLTNDLALSTAFVEPHVLECAQCCLIRRAE
jgi:hypothetical protein